MTDRPEGEPGTGLDVARQALAAARARFSSGQVRSGPVSSGSVRSGTARAGTGGSGRSRRSRPAADDRSGAHPDERDPQELRASVERLVAERGWETDAAVGGAMGRWAAVVGQEIADHCVPVRFADGELVVQAESTAWATQLRLLTPVIVRRLSEELGTGTVRFVRVLGPSAPSWKRGPLSVRGRGPRDTYG